MIAKGTPAVSGGRAIGAGILEPDRGCGRTRKHERRTLRPGRSRRGSGEVGGEGEKEQTQASHIKLGGEHNGFRHGT